MQFSIQHIPTLSLTHFREMPHFLRLPQEYVDSADEDASLGNRSNKGKILLYIHIRTTTFGHKQRKDGTQ